MTKTTFSTRHGKTMRSFSRLQDALEHAGQELRAGRCVTAWPTDDDAYKVEAWDFEPRGGQHGDERFAPTEPHELEGPSTGKTRW